MHEENRDTRIAPAAPERADAGSRHSPGGTLAGRFVLHERLVPPLTPWRYSFITGVSAVGSDQFLALHSDRATFKNGGNLSYLRAFMFDRDLRLTDGMWVVGPLKDREIDHEIEARPDQLGVTYWNGTAWQPEVCAIPQAK